MQQGRGQEEAERLSLFRVNIGTPAIHGCETLKLARESEEPSEYKVLFGMTRAKPGLKVEVVHPVGSLFEDLECFNEMCSSLHSPKPSAQGYS